MTPKKTRGGAVKRPAAIAPVTVTCPDCGQRANAKTTPDKEKTGYFLTIDCPHCEYYEFMHICPDI